MKVARYSIGALASGRRVPYKTFRDFGRSLKAREEAFTEEVGKALVESFDCGAVQVFHLFVGEDETSNEITVDDFDRLHLSSKDMRWAALPEAAQAPHTSQEPSPSVPCM